MGVPIRKRQVYRACESKERYASEHEAKKVADKRQRAGAIKLRWYDCSFCGGFHLTKKGDTDG